MFRGGCHSVARLARTIYCALDYPRSFRFFYKLADIGELSGLSLWNHQGGEISSIAFFKYTRAG